MTRKIIPILIPIIFLVSFFGITNKTNAQAVCTVKSAAFNPSGRQANSWYRDDTKQSVQVIVQTENCQNKTLQLSIVEQDSLLGNLSHDDISEVNHKSIPMGNNNTFILNLKAGETECEIGALGVNCNYYIEIYGDASFVSNNHPEGNLQYECDTLCQQDWIVGSLSLGSNYQDAARQGNAALSGNPQTSLSTDTNYTPLEPLPGLLAFDTDPDKNPCAFGKYLNILIKIITGFAAVLAMLMIVAGGLQYMTNELISSKEAGKERIRNAILGLLLILGAYTILNTINPALLNVCLSLEEVTITITEEEDAIPMKAGTPNAPSGDITAWAQQYGQVLTMTLQDGSTIALKPCDELLLVPYSNAFGTSFRLNKYLYNNISRLNAKWISSYKNYSMSTVNGGGYICKQIKDKNGKPTKFLSKHSYGIAVDFNSSRNARGTKGDMPSGLVQEWKKEGWGWGGDWKWTDPMHFSMGESSSSPIKGEK